MNIFTDPGITLFCLYYWSNHNINFKTCAFSYRLSKDEVDKLIIQIDDVLGQVNTQTTCDASTPYRTLDGSCNNLVHTEIGMVETPLTRVVGNAYGDGTYEKSLTYSSYFVEADEGKKMINTSFVYNLKTLDTNW